MHSINNEKMWFLNSLKNQSLIEKLKKIKLIITDIDGCLTNGTTTYSEDNEIAKNFSVQDGFIMTKCNKPNMPHLALITGRSDIAATKRAKKLGIPEDLYFQGYCNGKSEAVKQLQKKLSIIKSEILFFGDDFLDLEMKPYAGLFASPKNALFYIHHHSDIIIPLVGGDGAFRLLLDLILYVQKKHIAQQFISDALR